jgi:hypothetical protein
MNEKQVEDLADRLLKPGTESETKDSVLARTDFNVKALALLGLLAAAGKQEQEERGQN